MNEIDKSFIKGYEALLNDGYCNCNEMNCLDNNSPRRILNIVKQLQQENKQLKECYCNRTDCVGRIKDSKKYDSLYQKYEQLKKQKEDVIEYIKTTTFSDITGLEKHNITEFWFIKDLLRMLGEIDVED